MVDFVPSPCSSRSARRPWRGDVDANGSPTMGNSQRWRPVSFSRSWSLNWTRMDGVGRKVQRANLRKTLWTYLLWRYINIVFRLTFNHPDLPCDFKSPLNPEWGTAVPMPCLPTSIELSLPPRNIYLVREICNQSSSMIPESSTTIPNPPFELEPWRRS
ncbi:hypothetical protein SCHPADRAFT_419933 [Schizopora paradoxa]|uniref:Uncharacterized protein n=1 Tax=Schizopora paradoxa TaxID=27342 RepID=A0A0H2RSM7_9AGAM|nr:hypothetical protein SCHPADRAFT_419933 [Schizopora paradoxa]